MKRKLIRLLSVMINESGIHILKQPDHNLWRFLFIVLLGLSGMISIGMYSFQRYGDFDAFIIPATYETVAASLVGSLFSLFYYRDVLSEMLYQMDVNLYTYPDETSPCVVYPWYLNEENIVDISYTILYLELSAMFVIYIPIISEIVFYHKISPSLYPCWTPWNTNTFQANLLTLVIQIIQSIGGIWFNYVVNITMLVVVFEFQRQCERLRLAIVTLKQRTTMTLNNKKSVESEEAVMRRYLVSCIQHHRMLQKNFQLFKIWFSVAYSVELASFLLTFVFGFYCIVHVPSLSVLLNYIGVAIIVSVTLLIKCIIGEIFSDLSTNLSNAVLHDLDWSETSIENQKLLVMFHRIITRSFDLFGFDIIKANRITFASIIRFAYSSFNIINLAVKRRYSS